MRKAHVRLEDDGTMVFDYPAKSGMRQIRAIVDPGDRVVERLKRRRGGSDELLAYKQGGRWSDIRSGDINEYIKEITGERLLRQGLPDLERDRAGRGRPRGLRRGAATKTGRKRAIKRAVKEVAHYLGNTPAVCRASYIDPRVFDAYEGGLHHRPGPAEGRRRPAAARWRSTSRQLERAVVDLIDEREAAPGVEKIAA